MDETTRLPLTAVDRIANGNGLQMIKAAIPYLPAHIQRSFSVYIKLQEMQNVLSFYNHSVSACASSPHCSSVDELLSELRDYGTEEQRQTMDQALNVLQTLKMYQECKDLF